MAKPYLEEAGRLTDKSRKKNGGTIQTTINEVSVDEIVPFGQIFSLRFPELTDAEREVMAGETAFRLF